MEKMLNAYDGASSSPQDEMEAEEDKNADSKKKKAAASKAPATRATGKRTRASQRKQGVDKQLCTRMIMLVETKAANHVTSCLKSCCSDVKEHTMVSRIYPAIPRRGFLGNGGMRRVCLRAAIYRQSHGGLMLQDCWIWIQEFSWTFGSVRPAHMPTKTWTRLPVKCAMPRVEVTPAVCK